MGRTNGLRGWIRFAGAEEESAGLPSHGSDGGRIWREHGALEFWECVGDDLHVKGLVPFPRMLRLKRGETAVFSWIVFKSRAHRDRVNARVMKDPRLARMAPKSMPFDVKRMAYGGFKVLVHV